jgi:hypothetical protein
MIRSVSLDNYPANIRGLELSEAELLYWQGPIRSIRHYLNLFDAGKPFRVDISPSYGELPDQAVARIRDTLGPDVKIILSVRDPVERSWSNLKFDLSATGENPLKLSFAERVALYKTVSTMRRCDYASVLRRWQRFFDNIEVVFFDDIVAQPGIVLSRVQRFIGLTAWAAEAPCLPVNATNETAMPLPDRLFLFGLHQATYDASETVLGGPAVSWRRRQLELLD